MDAVVRSVWGASLDVGNNIGVSDLAYRGAGTTWGESRTIRCSTAVLRVPDSGMTGASSSTSCPVWALRSSGCTGPAIDSG